MMKISKMAVYIMIVFLLVGSFAFAQQDAKGCKDHPLFTRMPNTYIYDCKSSEFEAREYPDPGTQGKTKVKVEGKYFFIHYFPLKGFEGKRSTLQVTRNYQNAMKKIGGSIYEFTDRYTWMKLLKNGKEIWAYLDVYGGDQIRLEIVEKEEMVQEVVADAKTMAADISTSGKVAIYGIYFDFNKADVKPESEPTLKEITKLLQQDAKLKLYVVGHTDNVGGFDYNMKLSQQRAEAVVKELVSKYKITPDRLKAHGVGLLAPVTSNETEEGKAKNRRVELVKQ